MYGSHDMRHVDFRGLTGSQRTPRVWGVTWYEEYELGGHSDDNLDDIVDDPDYVPGM